jgi:hypothetical protein
MIVVLQLVINNGFNCRNSYRLLKRHQNSTLSAISRRDIITWTLIFHGIGLPCQNSRNRQPTIAIQTANNTRRPVLVFWRRYNFSFCNSSADDKFVLQNKLRTGSGWIYAFSGCVRTNIRLSSPLGVKSSTFTTTCTKPSIVGEAVMKRVLRVSVFSWPIRSETILLAPGPTYWSSSKTNEEPVSRPLLFQYFIPWSTFPV